MTAAVLLVLGVVLCFLGAVSLRIGVLAAGFAGGWLLAEALARATVTPTSSSP